MIDATRRDLAALQGVWEQVAFEENGVVDAPDEVGSPGALTTIDGDRFQVCDAHRAVLLHGRFELDASVTPKAITWIDAIGPDRDQRLPAIYELEGDTFAFVAADADMPRPLALHGGPGLTLRRFVRRGLG